MNDTPPMLEHHDSLRRNYYARLNAEIPGFEFTAIPIRNFLKNIIGKGEFYIRAGIEYLPEIVRSGRIKGSPETDHTTLNGGPTVRKQSCQAMFGCDIDRLKPEDYPKYGYLSCADPVRNLLETDEMSYQYGGVVFRLKKQNFMHRTTITVGDSVNMGRCFGLVPDRVDDILPVCVYGLENGSRKLMVPFGGPGNCWHYFVSKILNGTLTADNFNQLDALLGGDIPVFEFFELQFHGPINLAEDVDSVDIFDFRENVESEEVREAGRKLEAMGITFRAFSDFEAACHAMHPGDAKGE